MAVIKLSELARKEKVLVVDFEGSDIELIYNPSLFTKAFRAHLQEKQDEEGSLYDAIQETVLSWNISDDTGQMLSLDRDSLELLPVKLLYQVWLAIQTDTMDFLPKTKSVLSVAA